MLKIHEYWMKPGSQEKSVVFHTHGCTATTDNVEGLTGAVAKIFSDFDAGAGKSTYYREGASAVVALDLVTKSLGTWVTGGLLLLSDTLMPGCYVLDVPNAAIERGADYCLISLAEFDDAGSGQVLVMIHLIRSLATG